MILNMTITGTSSTKSIIIISIDSGSTVAAYSDSSYQTLVKTASEKSTGEYWLTGLDNGNYYIKATKGTDTSTLAYTIAEYGVYRIRMAYRTVPEFTYTGSYEAVKDDDTAITDITTYNETNWKIRFLTSGTLSFSNLYGASNGIDVFLVGGGGGGGTGVGNGGGGGGYTETHTSATVVTNTNYAIVIGDGGAANANGGDSSAFTFTAYGGKCRSSNNIGYGGEGGSGGGAATSSSDTSNHTKWGGGSDGSAGYDNGSLITTQGHGLGQGTTTREFGESNGTLYAGGGGAGTNLGHTGRVPQVGGAGGGGNGASNNGGTIQATAGTPNTGGGGGGGGYNNASNGAAGGSGIVIIRNTRL